jgi:magnesium chelatase subunit I
MLRGAVGPVVCPRVRRMESVMTTLAGLKRAGYRVRGVKDELRANLLRKIAAREPLFPGIVGYEESVIPALVNALLARHNVVLLGLRGQAKSRLVRSLTSLLDPTIPAVAGCEIHDDPLAPICRRCRDLVAEMGDETPIELVEPEARYLETRSAPPAAATTSRAS